jgi:hypothetical protein
MDGSFSGSSPSGIREGKAEKSEMRVRVPVTGGFKGFDLAIFTPGHLSE